MMSVIADLSYQDAEAFHCKWRNEIQNQSNLLHFPSTSDHHDH